MGLVKCSRRPQPPQHSVLALPYLCKVFQLSIAAEDCCTKGLHPITLTHNTKLNCVPKHLQQEHKEPVYSEDRHVSVVMLLP